MWSPARTLQLPNPAAGSDISTAVDPADRVRLLAVTAVLTTSATVANRLVGLRFQDVNGLTYFEQDLEADQAASRVIRYSWARGAGVSANTALTGEVSLTGGLPWLMLEADDRLETNTRNIDAADQWSDIVIRYEPGDSWQDTQALERLAHALGG